MIQKETIPEENIPVCCMIWPERIIWIIGIALFFGGCIYLSSESDKDKKRIYDQSWEIRDLKFDKTILDGQVKFYKDMDSLNNEYYLKLFNSLLHKPQP
jgi:hypothetical protein